MRGVGKPRRLRLLKGIQEVDGRRNPFLCLVMRNEPINLGFSFGGKGNHASRAVFGFECGCLVFMRAMLARSRSRTGSMGTVRPDAICASLRSSDSAIQSGGVISVEPSMAER